LLTKHVNNVGGPPQTHTHTHTHTCRVSSLSTLLGWIHAGLWARELQAAVGGPAGQSKTAWWILRPTERHLGTIKTCQKQWWCLTHRE